MITVVQYMAYDLHVDIAHGTAFIRCRRGDSPVVPATADQMALATKIAAEARAKQDALVAEVVCRTGKPRAIRRSSPPRLTP